MGLPQGLMIMLEDVPEEIRRPLERHAREGKGGTSIPIAAYALTDTDKHHRYEASRRAFNTTINAGLEHNSWSDIDNPHIRTFLNRLVDTPLIDVGFYSDRPNGTPTYCPVCCPAWGLIPAEATLAPQPPPTQEERRQAMRWQNTTALLRHLSLDDSRACPYHYALFSFILELHDPEVPEPL